MSPARHSTVTCFTASLIITGSRSSQAVYDRSCGPMAEFKLSMDFELCSIIIIIRSGFLRASYPFLELYRCLTEEAQQ